MRRTSLSLTALALIASACARDPVTPSPVAAGGLSPHVGVPVCDFITFGRLVIESNEGDIVISGNAGGNAPGGGILGEFEVHVGGVTYHVHTITEYEIPGNDPFGPFDNNANARLIVGTATTGEEVHLRLVDDPDPGAGEPGTLEGDMVFLEIDGDVILGTLNSGVQIERGNIQLHLNCRGPKR